MSNFDDFFGLDNFDSSLNVQNIIVEEQQEELVCDSQQIEIVQQRISILTEVIKQLVHFKIGIAEEPIDFLTLLNLESSSNKYARLKSRPLFFNRPRAFSSPSAMISATSLEGQSPTTRTLQDCSDRSKAPTATWATTTSVSRVQMLETTPSLYLVTTGTTTLPQILSRRQRDSLTRLLTRYERLLAIFKGSPSNRLDFYVQNSTVSASSNSTSSS